MTLTFNIEYRTNWGEVVKVWGSIPELGDNNPMQAIPLNTIDGVKWTLTIETDSIPSDKKINYAYCIKKNLFEMNGTELIAVFIFQVGINNIISYLIAGNYSLKTPAILVQRLPIVSQPPNRWTKNLERTLKA